MSFDGEETRWMCGRSGVVNLQRVSSIVREMREPCLHHSPKKANKMLKPEKWKTVFDSEGKVLGFRKALKLIIVGGVDPSIRAEVWEFLLGCYALSSTAEYRKQLRMAWRERYDDLMKQCQSMHSSIDTGSLAYVVGSKVMDMRTSSKDNDTREAATISRRASHDTANTIGACTQSNNGCTDTSYAHLNKFSSNQSELISVRVSAEGAAYDSSYHVPLPRHMIASQQNHRLKYTNLNVQLRIFFFPSRPVTNLFQDGDTDTSGAETHDSSMSVSEDPPRYDGEHMHSFQINNSVDLIIESDACSNSLLHASNGENEIFSSMVRRR